MTKRIVCNSGSLALALCCQKGAQSCRSLSVLNSQKESNMADGLSRQAKACIQTTLVSGQQFRDVRNNRYHPIDNPQGIADLGLAENHLCTDLLIEKMTEISRLPEPKELLFYEKATGNLSFRQTMKTVIERNFNSLNELKAEHLFITNGVTVILEAFAFAFADPGDYIMMPSPYYYRTRLDVFDRAGVLHLDVPLSYTNGSKQGRLSLRGETLEEVYQKAVSEGKRVRSVMFNNPVNPTGDVIDRDAVVELLDFAHRHKLHVLSNEIYALSVHDPEVKFTSILALPHPDPDRVHFAWGVSKDFGLSGYRSGFVHTKNPEFLQYLGNTLIYFRAAGIIQHRLKAFLEDQEWLDQVFFPTMKKRMRSRFEDLRSVLEEYGAHVHPSTATMFIWVDLTKFLPEPTYDGEVWLFHEFLKEKVFIVPGADYSPDKPGWFRIVISVDEPVYEEGKKAIIRVLKRIQHKQKETLS